MTAPAPTPAEAAIIDRFGIFDEERIVEEVARAMAEAQGCGRVATPLTRCLAAAAVAAYRAQDGGAEEWSSSSSGLVRGAAQELRAALADVDGGEQS